MEERRAISIRHARFNAALITTALVNPNRPEGTRPWTPFDFIPGYASDPEDDRKNIERQHIKDNIRLAFTELNCKTPDEARAVKARLIDRMEKGGVEDPEGLFREVFPDL